MKTKKLFCLLAVVCLMIAAVLPALGQETGAAYITEQAFSALLKETFPDANGTGLTGDETTLTFERALAALCGAVGLGGQTPAQNLAFAIENDLISGIPATGASPVTPDDARRMIAAFAAYQSGTAEMETPVHGIVLPKRQRTFRRDSHAGGGAWFRARRLHGVQL